MPRDVHSFPEVQQLFSESILIAVRPKSTLQSDAVDIREESQKEDSPRQEVQEPQQEPPVTSAPLKRKILRLTRYSETTEPTKSDSEERNSDSKPVRSKKLKRTKRVKKIKLQSTMSSDAVPLRAHCLNIRTFARQFGISDVDEFTRGRSRKSKDVIGIRALRH
ncbi:hypothetical protein OESDEN_01905 [Oesophagostomum dentatum]|uniref:aECM cysteine-cradle domain-containing protein n=1 Tax=Oesophagostomum dentatum TaxID=61180 RepID=A0A0B1TLK2_OESDE|nr:hypothetical protein OESDEN_01905 [Oesophagostomum dentatum]